MEKHGNKSSIKEVNNWPFGGNLFAKNNFVPMKENVTPETYPKNCTECNKHTTCKSWYGGCGCSEAPVTVFGAQENRKTLVIDET